MKIGLMTIHHVRNYGSKLQAYATHKMLSSMGHQCELINYIWPSALCGVSRSMKSTVLNKGNNVAKNLFGVSKKFKRYKDRMDNFLSANMSITKPILTRSEMHGKACDYDCVIAGSDQLWHPNGIKFDPTFLLDWVSDKTTKLSLASSFGVKELPLNLLPLYKKELTRFSAISVREGSALKILESLNINTASRILDPTFMLQPNDYHTIMPLELEGVKKPYVLIYGCMSNPNNYMENLAREIRKKTGWQIVRLNGKAYHVFSRDIKYVFDAGPAEYLALIKNAGLVLANSYHGTIFSINFQRPFYAIYPEAGSLGVRQKDVLSLLNLRDRVAHPFQSLSQLASLEFDFSKAGMILDEERMKSHAWLENNFKRN